VVENTIQTVRITKGHAHDLVGDVAEAAIAAAVRSFEAAHTPSGTE